MIVLKKSIENKNETLIVNGLNYEYKPPMTIMNLLLYFGFNTKIIVIDYNGNILPKELWQEKSINKKDSIEILTIAGGG